VSLPRSLRPRFFSIAFTGRARSRRATSAGGHNLRRCDPAIGVTKHEARSAQLSRPSIMTVAK